ncbi:phosphotransferase [Gracilibacillus sp. S3-1-1]|uniref:Phosphotransferase n=1 Tax=Gracilibacillus pellucidus TaxID=3095368 RepID=A0ACC6M7Y3_9BACI|nr:phosphotransferase [Gracilibacillus sp. S3-1-1]MDX8047074.1 phosphotransferase [Gracilibacillus sp. S3-1-1]
MWNPDTSRISGIIDFDGSGLGDPAYDFAGIFSSYGRDFLIFVLVYILMEKRYQSELSFIRVHSLCKKHCTGLRITINGHLKVELKIIGR